MNEKFRNLIRLALKFAPERQIVSVGSGNGLAPNSGKPLPEPMMAQFNDAYMRR